MKRILGLLKIGFLVASLFLISNNLQVSAIDEFEIENGCDTSTACSKSFTGYCTCGDSVNCSGCFIENGNNDCGTCIKRR